MITKDDIIRFCTSFDKNHNEPRTYVLASKVADELESILVRRMQDHYNGGKKQAYPYLIDNIQKLIETLRAKEEKK